MGICPIKNHPPPESTGQHLTGVRNHFCSIPFAKAEICRVLCEEVLKRRRSEQETWGLLLVFVVWQIIGVWSKDIVRSSMGIQIL